MKHRVVMDLHKKHVRRPKLNDYEKLPKNKKSKKVKLENIVDVYSKPNKRKLSDPENKYIKKKFKKEINTFNNFKDNVSDAIKSSAKEISKTHVVHSGDTTLESNNIAEKKKHKRKKKKRMSENNQTSSSVDHEDELTTSEIYTDCSNETKKHKKKKIKHEDSNVLNLNVEDSAAKELIKKAKAGEYKPGMLSEILQIRKYGRLIIPWDPSFGLDPNYKVPPREIGDPKLEINPLFDLSKRTNVCVPSTEKNDHSIFVGNLPAETNKVKIKKLFRKFGLIKHVKLVDKNSKSSTDLGNKKNHSSEYKKHVNAVIQFSTVESCKKALKMNGLLYEDHRLRVTFAKDAKKSDPDKSVFVGGLAYNVQDEDLWELFKNCGQIESVRVIRDRRSGKGKGFAFINFKSADSVEHALELNGARVLDKNIRVTRNKPNSESLSNSLHVKRRNKKKKKKRPSLGEEINKNDSKLKSTEQNVTSESKPKTDIKPKKKKDNLNNVVTSPDTKVKKKKKKKSHEISS